MFRSIVSFPYNAVSAIGSMITKPGGAESRDLHLPRGGTSPRHKTREPGGYERPSEIDVFHGITCVECLAQKTDREVQKPCAVHGFVQCRGTEDPDESGRRRFCSGPARVRRAPCGHRVLCIYHYQSYEADQRAELWRRCPACGVQVDTKAFYYDGKWHYSVAASELDKCCELKCLYEHVHVHDS